MPLAFIPGDIFASRAQSLVNPVNHHGVMGKGLAHAFATRFPAMFAAYPARCAAGALRPSVLDLYMDSQPWILNFLTTDHWRTPARLPYIVAGLEAFVAHYVQWGITSIAFPQLGCGNGRLAWMTVEPVMRQWLARLPIPVEIHVSPELHV